MKNNQEKKCSGNSFPWKLWIYTNYDCNLRCSYCVAKSSPNTPRRAIGMANVTRLVDEAVELGFEEIYYTGGEPFILKDIYDMLAYSCERVKTVALTNAMLLRGTRLERLQGIKHPNLTIQVSLDGATPEDHDPIRGRGSWLKAVEGIKLLLESGFQVTISTTETAANRGRLERVCEFHRSLGISEEHHFTRPLAKRGYSREGLELDRTNLVPEVTANLDGIFWHPLSTDADMQVSRSLFPLSDSVNHINEQMEAILKDGSVVLTAFT